MRLQGAKKRSASGKSAENEREGKEGPLPWA